MIEKQGQPIEKPLSFLAKDGRLRMRRDVPLSRLQQCRAPQVHKDLHEDQAQCQDDAGRRHPQERTADSHRMIARFVQDKIGAVGCHDRYAKNRHDEEPMVNIRDPRSEKDDDEHQGDNDQPRAHPFFAEIGGADQKHRERNHSHIGRKVLYRCMCQFRQIIGFR